MFMEPRFLFAQVEARARSVGHAQDWLRRFAQFAFDVGCDMNRQTKWGAGCACRSRQRSRVLCLQFSGWRGLVLGCSSGRETVLSEFLGCRAVAQGNVTRNIMDKNEVVRALFLLEHFSALWGGFFEALASYLRAVIHESPGQTHAQLLSDFS